ncbi:unnamed protein product, partial [marine sediment metagenome]
VPEDGINSLKDALTKAPLFMEYANSPQYKPLSKFAEDLDGLPKAWSTHAGGVIIGQRPLVECVPLRRDKDGVLVLEYEKKRAEKNGFVKMDLLSISNLDIINDTIDIIKKNKKTVKREDIEGYDNNDEETYKLISSGDTFGVFQLGSSGGAIELSKQMKPKSIEDLAMLTAIIRPNAADIRKEFIEARHSEQQ